MGTGSPGPSVVVVGAGHAGVAAAAQLRQKGFNGTIVLVGAQRNLPYHRPPLSKTYLRQADAAVEELRPQSFYEQNDIGLVLGNGAESIDPIRRRVRLADGSDLPYDIVVLATGSTPRVLDVPGATSRGVLRLHDLEDAANLRCSLLAKEPVVIVGGGYIGLEVAAAAIEQGCPVTVVERESRLLSRAASPELAAWLARHHVSRGASILTDANVTSFTTSADGSVSSVRIGGVGDIECGVALVGVGVVPNDALARSAGIDCNGLGVVVDRACRTSVEGVYAIGDVTVREVGRRDGRHRLESIPSATEQAGRAAADILGAPLESELEVPWFWSDQLDLKIKIAGLRPDGTTGVVRGDVSTGRFGLFHVSDGILRAVETVNSSPDFMCGKKWIAQGTSLDLAVLRDDSKALRDAEIPTLV